MLTTFRSNWSEVYLLVGSLPSLIFNFSHLEGVSVSAISSKFLLCVSIDEEAQPCPKAALDYFSLVLHPLPSLINNCLNLPTGPQGRSWKLNEGYFL